MMRQTTAIVISTMFLAGTAIADPCSDLIDVARQLLDDGRNDEAIAQVDVSRQKNLHQLIEDWS